MTRAVVSLRAGYTKHVNDVDCPNEEAHTAQPAGYLQWYDWAARMAKTHVQIRCPGCDRWAIWIALAGGEPLP